MLSEGEDKRCQALRQQDLIETSRSKASPAGKALQEGKGARGFKALGKREASGALPSPLPRPLPRPPQHELHTVLAGFRVEKDRSEEHTSELQSLMRISYAVFCLKKKKEKQRKKN